MIKYVYRKSFGDIQPAIIKKFRFIDKISYFE